MYYIKMFWYSRDTETNMCTIGKSKNIYLELRLLYIDL